MNETIPQNNKGLTLIEITVSIAVIIIISVPLLALLLNSVKINQHAEERMLATLLAQNEMEKIKGNDILWLGENQIEEKNEDDQFLKIMHTKNQNGFEITSVISAVKDFKFNERFAMKIKITNNQLEICGYDEKGEPFGRVVLKKNVQSLKVQKETLGMQNHCKISLYCDNNIVPITIFEKIDVPSNVKIEAYDIHTVCQIIGVNLDDNDILLDQNGILSLYIFRSNPPNGIALQPEIKTEGNVAVYDNLYIDSYPYRLYEVEITVKKRNKILEKIKGYKTFRAGSEQMCIILMKKALH